MDKRVQARQVEDEEVERLRNVSDVMVAMRCCQGLIPLSPYNHLLRCTHANQVVYL